MPHEQSAHRYVTPILRDSNSAVFDTGSTSSCGRTGDKFQPTTKKSHKIFHISTGETTSASTQAKLYHDVREPAKTVEMIPQLQHNSLISGSKFADANYITVLTPTEVLFYNGMDTHISVSNRPILKGWRDPTIGLWRVPLQPITPTPKYEFTPQNKTREDAIVNVYELPSADKSIRYIHACAGLPTKGYWIKAIKGGNYATWTNLTTEAMNQNFP